MMKNAQPDGRSLILSQPDPELGGQPHQNTESAKVLRVGSIMRSEKELPRPSESYV
jgi:hypothetical protein